MTLIKGTDEREQLINMIHACNDDNIKKQWIIEMSNMHHIECSESQCDSCLILNDCITTLEEHHG